MTKFLTHADYEKTRWICGSVGCNHWVNELEKQPVIVISRPYSNKGDLYLGEIII